LLPRSYNPDRVLTTLDPVNKDVIYPIILVEVDGIKTHALLDTGAGSSYASAKLINALNKQPKETVTKRIYMMLGSSTTRLEIYTGTLGSVNGQFNMNVEVTKVHKTKLLEVANPNYATLVDKYSHLKGVKIEDKDSRAQILIHLILGASEYATTKTVMPLRVGKPGEPVAEKTPLGWTLMSPGRKDVGSPILLTQSTASDYEQLCTLNVLGLSNIHVDDQPNQPDLPTNEVGSVRRLEQLIRKLQRDGQYEEYDNILQEQLQRRERRPTFPLETS